MATKSNNKQKPNFSNLKNEMEKYEVIGPLGEGSFGRVYKARMLSDNSFVALKVICKGRRSHKELVGLRRECEIQKHLHHPNIIQMLDSFETTNEIVVVTEFAHKELNTLLGKEGYLTEERAQPIICDLVSALNYLHSHRVLHRDLKPQNILIDSQSRAKLCDFGFARNMSTGTHVLTSIKGTPLYMAPELIEELPYDYKADLWSLGCIMYELLVGAPPFCTSSILHLIRLIRHEQIMWPTFLSADCFSFLKGLLQKDPAKRMSWEEILKHPFVNGHILICDDSGNMPLTRAMSTNTLQAKEQQRKDHLFQKGHIKSSPLKAEDCERGKVHKSTSFDSDTQDVKNNNLSLNEQMNKLSIDRKNGKSSSEDVLVDKLNFIEENHPIETDEWLVFLHKSMEEVVGGELSSLTQPNLTNIIVSPLRNSSTSPKVLINVVKLLSIPFVSKGVPKEVIDQIKKIYLEVKLIPNLMYSFKVLLREKETMATCTPSPSPLPLKDNYRNVNDLSEEDLQCLDYIFVAVTHLVHLENDFLSQFCDAVVVLNIFTLLGRTLLLYKNCASMVANLLSILTHIVRRFPENLDLIEKIILTESVGDSQCINFVELLRHNHSLVRERVCLFIMFVGKNLESSKMNALWSEIARETLEALMYDSIEEVRNAADKTVEELKHKEFYKLMNV